MFIRKFATCVIVVFVLAVPALSTLTCQTVESQAKGFWTGGFWLNGNWVAVLLRLNTVTTEPRSTADVIFPAYGSQNAINVAIGNFTQTSAAFILKFQCRDRTSSFSTDSKRKKRLPGIMFTANRGEPSD